MPDLFAYAGTDPAYIVTAERADGTPLDLTAPGTKVWITARDPLDDTVVFEGFADADGNKTGVRIDLDTPTSPEKNLATIVVDLSGFDAVARLPYDVLVEEPSGARDVLVSGWVHVRRPQSRPA